MPEPQQITAGTTYSNGGEITFTNLNNHVNLAKLAVGAITGQVDASAVALADTILLQQAGALKEASVAQIKTAMTLGDYLKKDGSVAMTTSSQLTLGTTTPLTVLHAVSLGHLQANYLKSSSSLQTLTGSLNITNALTTGVTATTPLVRLNTTGISMLTTAQLVTLSRDPVVALEATPKQYVDKYTARLAVQWNGIFDLGDTVAGSYSNNSTTSATFTANGHGLIAGCRFYATFPTGANLDTTLWTITSVATNTFVATPSVNVTNSNTGTFSIKKCLINSTNQKDLTLNSIISAPTNKNTYILNTVESIANNVVIITSSGNGLTLPGGFVSLDYTSVGTDSVVSRTNQSLVFACANQTGNKSGLVIF